MSLGSGTALVTGGRGFVGRHVVEGLRTAGLRAVTIGIPRPGDGPDHVAVESAADSAGFARALAALRPGLVVHLAAAAPALPAADQHAVTVAGTQSLLDALAGMADPPLLLAFGSAAEFGPVPVGSPNLTEDHPCAPTSAHGQAKHAAMQAVLRHAREGRGPACVLRLFTAAGPHAPPFTLLGRIAAEIAALPASGGVVRVAGPLRERDYLTVAEIGRLVPAIAAQAGALPPLLNLCSGSGTVVRDMVGALAAARGVPVRIALREDGLRRDDPQRVVGDPSRLRALGLMPTPVALHDLAVGIMAPWRG
ncbi:NAD-dependent epimerase/dehydratase family protein [Roseomonas fluvialis]|uniref:UDP-glucose 4-epimerase n=1 Tax=Roseomonas fluvialis TaxID=1750527 RepID=A0ABM7Y3F5_9PROT|nr:NAD(P)-dependent oxidoreductase [Roseomonas fluvialis]BDG72341.1 UDP-glucose 4-epimerase [Roseomonas fluvialis]